MNEPPLPLLPSHNHWIKSKKYAAVEATMQSNKGNKYWRSNETVVNFAYHALHKTGSTNVRAHLSAFCKDHKLNCLSYCACDLCTKVSTWATLTHVCSHTEMHIMHDFTIISCFVSDVQANNKEHSGCDNIFMHFKVSVNVST